MTGSIARRLIVVGSTSLVGYAGHKLSRDREKFHTVLDLDHTLVHCENEKHFHPDNGMLAGTFPNHDAKLGISENTTYRLHRRPGLAVALKALSWMTTVHAFTAGTEGYADHVVNAIDPGRQVFNIVLARKSLENIGDRTHCKDLEKILEEGGYPKEMLKNTVLVDDKRRSFVVTEERNQESNAIQVAPFYATSPSDSVLIKVVALVAFRKLFYGQLANKKDQRTIIRA